MLFKKGTYMNSKLQFNERSLKIFKYLFNTDKDVRLFSVTGDDIDAIDKFKDSFGVYTQLDPMHNDALPHNTCERYFRAFDFREEMTGCTVVFLYPETGMSIREQQKFTKELITKYINSEATDVDIVIFTNSLFILSDIPSDNVMIFNTEECRDKHQFFGANLYDMLGNLSPDIATGCLSADYGSKIIKFANEFSEKKNDGVIDYELIDLYGDQIIKNYINSKLTTPSVETEDESLDDYETSDKWPSTEDGDLDWEGIL